MDQFSSYPDYPSSRMGESPTSTRGFPLNRPLNRQPSRQFDSNPYAAAQPQRPIYPPAVDDFARYEPAQYEERMAPPSLNGHSNFPAYETMSWDYNAFGAINKVAQTVGGSRARISNRPMPPDLFQPLPPLYNAAPQPWEQHSHAIDSSINHKGRMQSEGALSGGPDDLIPTAIVIKNIPFAIKKEQLVDIMTSLDLPLPYAFNYHFDSGVFRGLAFANFSNPEETREVINALNHMDLQGRKLRVEYKRMLPAEQRERIERDKRERRGQLESQHRPMAQTQLHSQASMSSLSSGLQPAASPSPRGGDNFTLDFNEPKVKFYQEKLWEFKYDRQAETYAFPADLSADHRRIIHEIAQQMSINHRSEGTGEHRQVIVSKKNFAPPISQLQTGYEYHNPREAHHKLMRAATTNFDESRDRESFNSTRPLRGQHSVTLLGDSRDALSGTHGSQLRNAKSFNELRSFTPSPGLSSQGFPSDLGAISRYTESQYQARGTGPSGTPNLTPTSAGGHNDREDVGPLTSGFENLRFDPVSVAVGVPRPHLGRQNGSSATIRPAQAAHPAGPIGSQRPAVTGNYADDTPIPAIRQPTIPSTSEWSQQTRGFTGRPRQNGHINRGSDSSDQSNGALPRASQRY